MAVALTILARDASSLKRAVCLLTFSGTYTTGGEATVAGFLKDLSWSRIHMALFGGVVLAGADTGLMARFDKAAGKVLLFRPDQIDDFLEQLPNATAITHTVECEFIGEGNS